MKRLSKFEPQAYSLLRIVSGFMFATHGVQKMFGQLTDRPVPEFGTQAWFGGLIELVCGVLVMLGLKTRESAFLASGTMAVAYIQFHWKFAGGADFFPVVNHGELAVLYCFVFLLIATRGSGMWAMKKD